jgi:HlyD family secretion protein
MPRILRWTLVLAALVLLFWILRLTVFRPKPVEVEVARVERGVVENTVTNSQAATVRSRLRARVGAELAGRVAAIPEREGAEIETGDLLVELDDTTAERRLDLAREDLATARARRDAAAAAADLARRELERAESLAASGLVSKEQLDAARAEADGTAADASAARAQIERAQASVRLSQQELTNHRVVAPFDGVVAEVLVEIGESVLPGQPLIEMLDPERLYVSAELDEVDIGCIHSGLPARVEFDPFPDIAVPGTVTRVSPYVSDLLEQNRTLEVEVEFRQQPDDPHPRPGTSSDVEIILERQEDVLRVPTFSIIESDHVLVVEDGRARERSVGIGLRNWDYTEILSGLDEGEKVITSLDRVQLRSGMRVREETPEDEP